MSETPEFDGEPVPGLPEPLPAGERILWQGSPLAPGLAVRAMHLRKVAVYFLLLLVWFAWAGAPVATLATYALLAVVAAGLLAWLAKKMADSALYTITNRRVVMRFGVAVPIAVNLPFSSIAGVDLRRHDRNSGDIAMRVSDASVARLGYAILWPHARPWRTSPVEPMLRCLPDVDGVAETLLRAIENESRVDDVRYAVAGNDPGPRAAAARVEPFPRAPLYGAAALLAISLASVALYRLGGPEAAVARTDDAMASISLRFEDRSDGSVLVRNADTGEAVDVLPSGSNNFLRATLRSLVRDRQALRDDSQAPFGLYALDDGRLLLVDSVSGRQIDLRAFGKTNAKAFRRFLPQPDTLQVTQAQAARAEAVAPK